MGRSFPALFQFLGFFGDPKGSHFSLVLFGKVPFFLKRWDPRFCTPLQRFGLILQGLGPPAGAKKRKKQLPNYHRFFDVEAKGTQTVFYHFKHVFGVILGSLLVDFWSLLVDFWKLFAAFLGKCLGDRSGTALGFILD